MQNTVLHFLLILKHIKCFFFPIIVLHPDSQKLLHTSGGSTSREAEAWCWEGGPVPDWRPAGWHHWTQPRQWHQRLRGLADRYWAVFSSSWKVKMSSVSQLRQPERDEGSKEDTIHKAKSWRNPGSSRKNVDSPACSCSWWELKELQDWSLDWVWDRMVLIFIILGAGSRRDLFHVQEHIQVPDHWHFLTVIKRTKKMPWVHGYMGTWVQG